MIINGPTVNEGWCDQSVCRVSARAAENKFCVVKEKEEAKAISYEAIRVISLV